MLFLFLPVLFLSLTSSDTKVVVGKRDPFYVSKISPSRKIDQSIKNPKILGIICGSKNCNSGAIVKFVNGTKIVRVGDKINGFKIVKIMKS